MRVCVCVCVCVCVATNKRNMLPPFSSDICHVTVNDTANDAHRECDSSVLNDATAAEDDYAWLAVMRIVCALRSDTHRRSPIHSHELSYQFQVSVTYGPLSNPSKKL